MVSTSQFEKMKHALGLNYGDKQTRNAFYCNANDPEWNDLVEKGLARKKPGWDDEQAYFILTDTGINVTNAMNSR